MKSATILSLLVTAAVLSACNFTLAEDIPPPPGYVAPTPMPTLGALYPAAPPDVQNGGAIFSERCAPCHGTTGLGDGPQSMQLPVTVPGIGLPEVAREAAPAEWFKTVTQGNLDRFMPPFVGSLSDQERWDVVTYALTLHTTADDLARGKSLVEADCPNCASAFKDLEEMASLSQEQIVRLIRQGDTNIPAFAQNYADPDAYAAASHLRSLTFAPPAQIADATTTAPEAGASEATPEAAGTSLAAESAASAPGVGPVSGVVKLTPAEKLRSLTVTLHGFDHGVDQSSGPQEVLTLSATIAADGRYVFEDVELKPNRIFLADVEYAGVNYRSEFVAAGDDSASVTLPVIRLHEPSTDVTLLTVDQVHLYTDFATAGTVQVLEIFAFSNNSDKAVIISTDGVNIPFIQLPVGAVNQGYEAGQDSEPFVAADDGLAVVPSEKPYSIIAFFNLPYDKTLEFKQPLTIDATSVLLLVPDGIKVTGDQLVPKGLQVFQNNNFQEFSASNLKSGDALSFKISGRPRSSSATALDAHQGWLIGGGALGIALILGGVYLYVRERRRYEADPPETEFRSADEVLDAILALDDLHRAGKISDSAHQARRNELKETLRNLS